MIIKCAYCHKTPAELEEYTDLAQDMNMTPDQFVISEEGTYNAERGLFVCTNCYIGIGMPSKPGAGWKAGDPI